MPVRWIRGNGEREVAEAANGGALADEDIPGRTAAITAIEIGADRARSLGELPLSLELDGVLFCHASPRRDNEMLTRLSSLERWADALTGIVAALVVAGHTHQQDDRVVDGVRFVDAGSVGQPYEGDGAARWLWLADGVPELRSTKYYAVRAGRRILATSWPDPESVKAALIEPVHPGAVTEEFEEIARTSRPSRDCRCRQQTIAQARCMKARCWSGSRSQRMRSLRNWCSQVKLRSTTQRWVPRPEPCSSPRRAISGLMPRAQSSRRYLSWS